MWDLVGAVRRHLGRHRGAEHTLRGLGAIQVAIQVMAPSTGHASATTSAETTPLPIGLALQSATLACLSCMQVAVDGLSLPVVGATTFTYVLCIALLPHSLGHRHLEALLENTLTIAM